MAGPAPSMNPRRRNARVGVVVLPAAGYQGDIPAWPLMPDIVMSTRRDVAEAEADAHDVAALEAEDSRKRRVAERRAVKARSLATVLGRQIEAMEVREAEVWAEVWRMPQAVEWARLRWVREVALYVRHSVKAELGSLKDAQEARMLSDRLGTTNKAMRSLLWVIGDDVAGSSGSAAGGSSTGSKASGRGRHLKAVDRASASA